MKFSALIFDLDGVLVHTDKFHYLAWKSLAESLGITTFDEKVNERLKGVSRMTSLEIVLSLGKKEYSASEKQAFAETKNTLYREYLSKMTPDDVTNEVRGTLRFLKARGIKIGLGSVSKNAPYILERTDLEKYFDAVSDGNGLINSKPDPEVFLKAAERLAVSPKDSAVVEDAAAGIDAAIAGGFYAIAYNLQYAKANIQIKDFSLLKQII
ncbi:MAG: beta-phosphoglucomutase [Christensenellaceae bacterium]|jgi:beta-phosphoglucomutase|nr:beta-phosphoglucomutase [Christensenellaceae bacterium]